MKKLDRNIAVGQRLKKYRLFKGLTINELSNRIGISKGYLSEIENGKKSFGQETLYSLLENFNIHIHWLFTGNGEMEYIPKPGEIADFDIPFGVAERLDDLRIENNLSIKQFAKSLEVTEEYLNKIINDGEYPNEIILLNLASVYKISIHWLFEGTGDQIDNDSPNMTFSQYMAAIKDFDKIENRLNKARKIYALDMKVKNAPETLIKSMFNEYKEIASLILKHKDILNLPE